MYKNARTSRILSSAMIGVICVICMVGMGCKSPVAVLPQVGPQAVPDIRLPDRPSLRPFSVEEFDAVPTSAHGKILTYLADVQSYADQADIAVEGYRAYIRALFDKQSIRSK